MASDDNKMLLTSVRHVARLSMNSSVLSAADFLLSTLYRAENQRACAVVGIAGLKDVLYCKRCDRVSAFDI